MTRFSRINTIWRKELLDTLRDRRTLIAMIFVPVILYPALMLGSLQVFELQASNMRRSQFKVAVPSAAARVWLQTVLDTDIVRHPEAASRPVEELPAFRERLRLQPATSQALNRRPRGEGAAPGRAAAD